MTQTSLLMIPYCLLPLPCSWYVDYRVVGFFPTRSPRAALITVL